MTGKYDEDLEQEVYIKTWQNLKNYEENKSVEKLFKLVLKMEKMK